MSDNKIPLKRIIFLDSKYVGKFGMEDHHYGEVLEFLRKVQSGGSQCRYWYIQENLQCCGRIQWHQRKIHRYGSITNTPKTTTILKPCQLNCRWKRRKFQTCPLPPDPIWTLIEVSRKGEKMSGPTISSDEYGRIIIKRKVQDTAQTTTEPLPMYGPSDNK